MYSGSGCLSNVNTESGNSESLGEIQPNSKNKDFPSTKVGEKMSDGFSITESQGKHCKVIGDT